jgi:hypothetical protein
MHVTIVAFMVAMVPMPVGAARSYMQILDGNNICTALFLLLCAVQLFAIASSPSSSAANRVLFITALALVSFAIVSAIYFFPVPTAFTGIAAVLCISARSLILQRNSEPHGLNHDLAGNGSLVMTRRPLPPLKPVPLDLASSF